MPLPLENYLDAARDNEWVRTFLKEWRLDWATGGDDVTLAVQLGSYAQSSPDAALALLVSLAEQAEGDRERVAISEGVLSLLMFHGETYWDTLNCLCIQVPSFRDVFSCVWGAGLPLDLQRKVDMWKG